MIILPRAARNLAAPRTAEARILSSIRAPAGGDACPIARGRSQPRFDKTPLFRRRLAQGFPAALGGLGNPASVRLKLRQKVQTILLHLSPQTLALFLSIRDSLLRPLLRLARYLALLHKRPGLLPALLDDARRLLSRPPYYLICLFYYLLRLADIVGERSAKPIDDSEKGRLIHAPGAAKEVPPRLPVQKVLKLRDYLGGLRGWPPFRQFSEGGLPASPGSARDTPPAQNRTGKPAGNRTDKSSFALQPLAQALLHYGRNEAAHLSAQPGYLLHYARVEVEILVPRHQENGFNLFSQRPVHQGHLELSLEVADGAQALDDNLRPLASSEINQQPAEAFHLDIFQVGARLSQHLLPFGHREKRCLGRILRHGHNNFVEEGRRPLHDIQMPICHGVEAARVDGSLQVSPSSFSARPSESALRSPRSIVAGASVARRL